MTTPLEMARIAASAADDKKAEDIVLLDLEGVSDVCDYFLICTAANARRSSSVVDEVIDRVRANCGVRPISSEGRDDSTWVLLDYGSLVVHVFLPETRDFYRLERLWGDCSQVDLGLAHGADKGDDGGVQD
ncbi:MAG: ribosome silencing factor [Atopobiaceae bacterium]|jgi:ribosome-associated protein|nr:ribosome silencing factor [Atopobiaceae bacterium]MCH4180061.1 ribosome silencing factor [Atopobiaceae bacterium]MCH4213887.1 ribosome silencing factor [Atopobiaceae bacterium]MCH4230125.1 ribosome silencing factor [Atopobiaceae bacterium]MCH4275650.1 ribosome silencing factor [Atopobiaceae bacterium]